MEDEVTELKCEVSHTVQELRTVVDELQEEQSVEIQQLKTGVTESSKRTHLCESTRGRSYKPENEYSESYRRKLKRDRTKNCTNSLSWLEIGRASY